MSNWSNIEADYLAELGRRPAAQQPATLGEIWRAEWASAGLHGEASSWSPLYDSYDELAGKLEGLTGTAIAPLDPGRNTDEQIAGLQQIAGALPQDHRKEIEPLLDVRSRAADRAAAIERAALDVEDRTYGLAGHATAFLAGLARQALQPTNLIALPFGMPAAGGLVATLGREAVMAGALQALAEPAIQRNRRELGLSSGIGEAAADIGGAAVAGAGLAGLLRAGGWALGRFVRPDGIPMVGSDDLHAAAALAERDAVFDAAAGADRLDHDARLQSVADGLERGRIEQPDSSAAASGISAPGQREAPEAAPGTPQARETASLPDLPANATILRTEAHGPVVEGLAGRWAEARDWLLAARQGDAIGVLSHPEVPAPIDVIAGTRDYGLIHIAELHPEVLPDLPERLQRMSIYEEGPNRMRLRSPDGNEIAVIRKTFADNQKHWLLTAFDRRAGGRTESPGGLSDPARSPGPPIGQDIGPGGAGRQEVIRFKTAKGSSYVVHEDGSTTRDKAFRPEHGAAEQGPQPRSQTTFYVTPDDANALGGRFQARGGAKKIVAPLGDGRWGVKYIDGASANKFERDSVVSVELAPRENLIPVEIWNDGRRVHFGNKITEMQRRDTAGVQVAAARPRLGDPALAAEYDRALAVLGAREVQIEQPDGSIKSVRADAALDQARDMDEASRALQECLGGVK